MSYKKELVFAKDLAYESGRIMRRYFRAEDIGTEWKKDNTPLTVADTKINDLVIKRVKQMFPEHGVLGEEASFKSEREFIWVVDPIDGTVAFSLDVPISTFSLALVDRSDGQPILAVVYDPQLDHLYEAVKGKGSYLNGVRLKSSKARTLKRQYVAIESGLDRKEKGYSAFKQGKCVDVIRDQGARCFSGRSCVYFSVKVASGQLVGSIFGYGSPWDAAAASLIVEEAGGIAVDFNGKPRRYDGFADGSVLAANKTMLTKLLEAIEKARP